MRRLIGLLAALLVAVFPAAGEEPARAFVEAFLEALPCRVVYWTTRDIDSGTPYTGFSTILVNSADDGRAYYLQESGLVSAESHPSSSWQIDLTHYFTLIPTSAAPLTATAPDGREVTLLIAGGTCVATVEQAAELRERIDSFSFLSMRYSQAFVRQTRTDPSAALFGAILYTLVTAGIPFLLTPEDGPLERLSVFGLMGMSGALAGMGWASFVTEKREQRRDAKQLEALAHQMTQMISDLSTKSDS